MFVIEDDIHADQHGEFSSFEEAVEELRRRAKIPWNEMPNQAPCMSWATCGRKYVVIEYDDRSPRSELQRVDVLDISASGVKWAEGVSGDE